MVDILIKTDYQDGKNVVVISEDTSKAFIPITGLNGSGLKKTSYFRKTPEIVFVYE